MKYCIAYDKYWCDEYGFVDEDSYLKFKKDNPDLTISDLYENPILASDD